MKPIDVHRAAREGDIDAVRAFLEQGGDAKELDCCDCEPLYYAVKHDHLEIAQLLLDAGGQINRNSKLRGDPIGAAVWNVNPRMLKFVVSAGVDVNRLRHGETPLDLLDTLRRFAKDNPEGFTEAELNEFQQLLVDLGARRARDDT
jgi:ankyrin repeat protein